MAKSKTVRELRDGKLLDTSSNPAQPQRRTEVEKVKDKPDALQRNPNLV